MKDIFRPAVPLLLVACLAAGCTTTAAPSRQDTFLCGDELIELERGVAPPSTSCTPVINWSSRASHGRPPAQCGPRIADEDVEVVEVMDVAQATDSFVHASTRYRLEDPGWFAISARSTDVATANHVRRVAANAGCRLLVLGPTLSTEKRWEGQRTMVTYWLVRLGSPAGP